MLLWRRRIFDLCLDISVGDRKILRYAFCRLEMYLVSRWLCVNGSAGLRVTWLAGGRWEVGRWVDGLWYAFD